MAHFMYLQTSQWDSTEEAHSPRTPRDEGRIRGQVNFGTDSCFKVQNRMCTCFSTLFEKGQKKVSGQEISFQVPVTSLQ